MTDPKEAKARARDAATRDEVQPSFEESIRRLGEIVKQLEDGELSLEASLDAFERGIVLARDAQRRLDQAEARVEELLSVDDQGRAVTRPIREA